MKDVTDKFAVVLSALCIVHCALSPFVVLLVPYFAGVAVLAEETVHLWLLVIILPVSLTSVIASFKTHKCYTTLSSILIGVGLLLTAVFFGHDYIGHTGEVALTLFGSVLVAYGHVRNFKLRNNFALKGVN